MKSLLTGRGTRKALLAAVPDSKSLAKGHRNREMKPSQRQDTSWALVLMLLVPGLFLETRVDAAEIIFLQDGRTIQAEKTEIIGDRIRIEKQAGMIELPKSDVLSIHPVAPPTASSSTTPPAEVYPNLTQQMTEKVRREIQSRPGNPPVR